MLYFSQRILLVLVLSISALHSFVAATPVPGNVISKKKPNRDPMKSDEMLIGYHGTREALAESMMKGIKVQKRPGVRRYIFGPGFYIANAHADAEYFATSAGYRTGAEETGPVVCAIYVKTKAWGKIRWRQWTTQDINMKSTKDSAVWGPYPSNPTTNFQGQQLAASQALIKAVKMRANCEGPETETVHWPTH